MKQQGFTIIELMITIVIVGILAAIAFSASTKNSAKAGRANAKGVLVEIRGKEEQYFINNKTYTDDLKELRYVANTGDRFYIDNQGQTSSSTKGVYEVTLTNADTYTATATAINKQASDDAACKVMTLNASGIKSPASCW